MHPSAQPTDVGLAWLVKLRWGSIAGQVATIAAVDRLFGIPLPIGALVAIVAIELVSNLAVSRWSRRSPAAHPGSVAAVMALDIVLFTGMLYLTGGPFNPFSSLYLVHIALAALVFRSTWSWGLMALAMLCFAGLFLDYRMLPELQHGMAPAPVHGGHMGVGSGGTAPGASGDQVHLHLRGMWVAFTVAAGFIVHFLRRIRSDLARRDEELAHARLAAARSERLASLATLAAGAAHELSTPLSTIAVVARELGLAAERGPLGGECRQDIQLIRDEVGRCRDILQRMAADAGQNAGEQWTPIAIGSLLTDSLSGLPDTARVATTLDPQLSDERVYGPRRALEQALRGVVKNALQATTQGGAVTIRAEPADSQCRIVVVDSGEGMEPATLERAGEPFFTTKAHGAGMGLGLFLTRTVVERVGGQLRLESRRGHGASVTILLPRGGAPPQGAEHQPTGDVP